MRTPPLPRNLWLVKRGPNYGQHFHDSLVPDSIHPVVICTERHVAFWEAGWTGDGATVWHHAGDVSTGAGGWLLARWKGFDIDYGHVVRGLTLPDDSEGGIVHRARSLGYDNEKQFLGYDETPREPYTLFEGATWWSLHRMPDWLASEGASLPSDEHSRRQIVDHPGHSTLSWPKAEKLRAKWDRYHEPWA